MKITIHIENATPAALVALSQITSIQFSSAKPVKPAPVLKKDGTPAKKRGRPVGSTKKVKV